MGSQGVLTGEDISDLFVARAVSLAGLSLLAYDFVLTIPCTVELIWRSQRSITKSIYLFNRYVSMAYISIFVLCLFHFESSTFCFTVYIFTSILNVLCLSNYHVVMLIRTWAVWRLRTAILTILVTMLVLKAGSISVIAVLSLISIKREGYPLGPVYNSCITKLPSYMFLIWVSSLGIEFLLFVLMMTTIRHEHVRHSYNTPLVRALFRGSIIYFIMVVFSGFFNIFVLYVLHLITKINFHPTNCTRNRICSTTNGDRPTRLPLALVFTLCLVNIAGQRLILDIRRSDLFSKHHGDHIQNRSTDSRLDWTAMSNIAVLTSIMFEAGGDIEYPVDGTPSESDDSER